MTARKKQPPPVNPMAVAVPFIRGLGFYAVQVQRCLWVITTPPDARNKVKVISERFFGDEDKARERLKEYTDMYLASRPRVEELPCVA